MKTLTFYLVLFFCLIVQSLTAQNSLKWQTVEDVQDYCSQLAYSNNEQAKEVVANILGQLGIFKNTIEVHPCMDIDNALATILRVGYNNKGEAIKKPFIVYDPKFLAKIKNESGSIKWSAISIMAHEIGHHHYNHVLDNSTKTTKDYQTMELEADNFSGYILRRMGATLEEAISAAQTLPEHTSTYSTHPGRAERIAAITEGWHKAGGFVYDAPKDEEEKVKQELQTAINYYDNKDYNSAFAILNKHKNSPYFSASAMTNLGYMYDQGNGVTQSYANAKYWYEKAADLGNASAMTNLGIMYKNGQGVTQSYANAKYWYQKACDLGNKDGCNYYKLIEYK